MNNEFCPFLNACSRTEEGKKKKKKKREEENSNTKLKLKRGSKPTLKITHYPNKVVRTNLVNY